MRFFPVIFESLGYVHEESVRVLHSIASRRALQEGRCETEVRYEFMCRLSAALQRANANIRIEKARSLYDP